MNEIRICRSTCMYCDENSADATYIVKQIFNATPITEELLKLPPADGSTIPKELWKKGDNQLSVNENRSLCKLRHKNGNCLCVGGFCTAVNDEICKSIRMAYEKGYVDGKSDAVRLGKWVETDTYPKCSVCELYGVSDMNYCPSCGARMDKEENE